MHAHLLPQGSIVCLSVLKGGLVISVGTLHKRWRALMKGGGQLTKIFACGSPTNMSEGQFDKLTERQGLMDTSERCHEQPSVLASAETRKTSKNSATVKNVFILPKAWVSETFYFFNRSIDFKKKLFEVYDFYLTAWAWRVTGEKEKILPFAQRDFCQANGCLCMKQNSLLPNHTVLQSNCAL